MHKEVYKVRWVQRTTRMLVGCRLPGTCSLWFPESFPPLWNPLPCDMHACMLPLIESCWESQFGCCTNGSHHKQVLPSYQWQHHETQIKMHQGLNFIRICTHIHPCVPLFNLKWNERFARQSKHQWLIRSLGWPGQVSSRTFNHHDYLSCKISVVIEHRRWLCVCISRATWLYPAIRKIHLHCTLELEHWAKVMHLCT